MLYAIASHCYRLLRDSLFLSHSRSVALLRPFFRSQLQLPLSVKRILCHFLFVACNNVIWVGQGGAGHFISMLFTYYCAVLFTYFFSSLSVSCAASVTRESFTRPSDIPDGLALLKLFVYFYFLFFKCHTRVLIFGCSLKFLMCKRKFECKILRKYHLKIISKYIYKLLLLCRC